VYGRALERLQALEEGALRSGALGSSGKLALAALQLRVALVRATQALAGSPQLRALVLGPGAPPDAARGEQRRLLAEARRAGGDALQRLRGAAGGGAGGGGAGVAFGREAAELEEGLARAARLEEALDDSSMAAALAAAAGFAPSDMGRVSGALSGAGPGP
jgi:hypothetical protein